MLYCSKYAQDFFLDTDKSLNFPSDSIYSVEAVWPGKYRADGSRNIAAPPNDIRPLHLVEEHPRGARSGNWGKICCGDNLQVMHALLPEYAGKVRLVYLDPPFDVGCTFSSEVNIGDRGERASVGVDYVDRWTSGVSYAQFMFERLLIAREFLTEDGTLYLHCDYRSAALLRLICDEIFGKNNLRNEIIWSYNSGPRTKTDFGRRHDSILRYSKSSNCYFDADAVREPYSPDINIPACKAHYYHSKGKVPGDVWNLPIIAQNDKQQRAGYATQKPKKLLERIILASSAPGDIVADFFCGSGTTAVVADELGRNYLACDIGTQAISVSRRRLSMHSNVPFGIYQLDRPETEDMFDSRLSVSAEITASSLKISLQSYVPSAEAVAAVGERENPFDYIDTWSIDTDYNPPCPFTCCASTSRTRKSPKLPLILELQLPSDRPIICVRAIDIQGCQSRTLVSL